MSENGKSRYDSDIAEGPILTHRRHQRRFSRSVLIPKQLLSDLLCAAFGINRLGGDRGRSEYWRVECLCWRPEINGMPPLFRGSGKSITFGRSLPVHVHQALNRGEFWF